MSAGKEIIELDLPEDLSTVSVKHPGGNVDVLLPGDVLTLTMPNGNSLEIAFKTAAQNAPKAVGP